MSRPLTELAHDLLRTVLEAGDHAVDATAGNGHDTRFLAEAVGDKGRVLGLDIQEAAIRVTGSRLARAGLSDRVTLLQAGHERLDELLPAPMRGNLKAVMFNLGYLPGGDRARITRPDTTLTALAAALDHLRPDGVISLLVYRGHPGGDDEYVAIHHWLDTIDCPVRFPAPADGPDHMPVLLHLGPGVEGESPDSSQDR